MAKNNVTDMPFHLRWMALGSWRSGYAVGLSAVSFSAALAKDAAPIPNAWGSGVYGCLLPDVASRIN